MQLRTGRPLNGIQQRVAHDQTATAFAIQWAWGPRSVHAVPVRVVLWSILLSLEVAGISLAAQATFTTWTRASFQPSWWPEVKHHQ